MALTVFIFAAAYIRIIEKFPHGGGGYVVAPKLLGECWGVVSGTALLVDYILSITVSIAASCDALYGFLPMAWHVGKLPFEMLAIIGLTTLNIRRVKESVMAMLPIILVFLITHIAVVLGRIIARAPEVHTTVTAVHHGF